MPRSPACPPVWVTGNHRRSVTLARTCEPCQGRRVLPSRERQSRCRLSYHSECEAALQFPARMAQCFPMVSPSNAKHRSPSAWEVSAFLPVLWDCADRQETAPQGHETGEWRNGRNEKVSGRMTLSGRSVGPSQFDSDRGPSLLRSNLQGPYPCGNKRVLETDEAVKWNGPCHMVHGRQGEVYLCTASGRTRLDGLVGHADGRRGRLCFLLVRPCSLRLVIVTEVAYATHSAFLQRPTCESV